VPSEYVSVAVKSSLAGAPLWIMSSLVGGSTVSFAVASSGGWSTLDGPQPAIMAKPTANRPVPVLVVILISRGYYTGADEEGGCMLMKGL
jgi:hypothetical protein